jgi:heptosyltransferase-2
MTRLRPELEQALAGRPSPSLSVVRAGGLGDTILVLPALELLRRACPGLRLTLVGSAWAEVLLPLVPFPLRLVRFDSPALTPLFGPGGGADPTGALAGADAVIIYTARDDHALARNARRLCAGPVVEWPVHPDAECHAAAHFARAAFPDLAGPAELPAPELRVPAPLAAPAQRQLDGWFGPAAGVLAVHAGSGGRHKCWPPEQFASLLDALGCPAILVEGPADAKACRQVLSLLPSGAPVHPVRCEPLDALAALLARCRAYVGNDSGMSHLAAALGTPAVAVFGPTDPAVWGPLGPRAACARGKGGAWPSTEAVAGLLRPHLSGAGTA